MASYLVMLTMLIRVMMPVAHASTVMSGKASGLMMAICSASNLGKGDAARETVYIPIELDSSKQETKPTSNHQSKCTVCYQVDESTLENFNVLDVASHTNAQALHLSVYRASHSLARVEQHAIRAPPLFI